jgi:hypothetical protein
VLGKFGLPPDLPTAVKLADLVALATEQRDLMPEHDDVWETIEGLQPNALNIIPLSPLEARWCFMQRFNSLVKS